MTVVVIAYDAVPNESGAGWLPAIWVDGRRVGSTWLPEGHDRAEALALAKAAAREEMDRYIGDWEVTVRPSALELAA